MTVRASCIAHYLVIARSDSDEAIQSDVSGGRAVEVSFWIASLTLAMTVFNGFCLR